MFLAKSQILKNIARVSYIGITTAFQAVERGSTPLTRSINQRLSLSLAVDDPTMTRLTYNKKPARAGFLL